jgi:hypothetical protein
MRCCPKEAARKTSNCGDTTTVVAPPPGPGVDKSPAPGPNRVSFSSVVGRALIPPTPQVR